MYQRPGHPDVEERPEPQGRPGEQLRFTHDRARRGTVVIRLLGDVDLLSAPTLATHVARHGMDRARLVLDLRQVTFCDARGVHVLLEAARAARERDVEMLVLIERGGIVERILLLCGADRDLRIASGPDAGSPTCAVDVAGWDAGARSQEA